VRGRRRADVDEINPLVGEGLAEAGIDPPVPIGGRDAPAIGRAVRNDIDTKKRRLTIATKVAPSDHAIANQNAPQPTFGSGSHRFLLPLT
jgi:hypothetical protein